MKLHTLNINLAVPNPHHESVMSLRGDLENFGDAVALDDE